MFLVVEDWVLAAELKRCMCGRGNKEGRLSKDSNRISYMGPCKATEGTS